MIPLMLGLYILFAVVVVTLAYQYYQLWLEDR